MEEANQLVEGKINHIMNHFVFTADIASNEVFTYHQATKQPDWKDFLTAMENELRITKSENIGRWSNRH